MSLILSRRYPDDPDERNREHFWSVTSEGVSIGSVTYNSTRPEPIWNWSITVQFPSPAIGKTGQADTRDEAMQQFREAWDRYREWLGDDRWLQWIKHMELVDARAKNKRY
jgi:hypothetical protein